MGRAVVTGPGFGRRHVRARERIGPDHRRGLGLFGVCGRIDYGRRGRYARHIASLRPGIELADQETPRHVLGNGPAVSRAPRLRGRRVITTVGKRTVSD
jgi:hypothetical protein